MVSDGACAASRRDKRRGRFTVWGRRARSRVRGRRRRIRALRRPEPLEVGELGSWRGAAPQPHKVIPVATLSEQELAELAACPLDHIRRLIDLGILVRRDEDEPFRSSDAHLVRVMAAFDRAGISLDDVARGVASGELTFRLDLFLSEPMRPRERTRRSPPTSGAHRSCCGNSAASSVFRHPPTIEFARRTPRCSPAS